jgi:hypothetical protein
VVRRDNEEMTARRHAAEIKRFWRNQGFLVSAWVERVEGSNAEFDGWAVRSDLVNGHPTKRIPE